MEEFEPVINIDDQIVDAITDRMLLAVLTGQTEVVERFLKLGTFYHSFLFFHEQTISALQETIFADKQLRDFIYSCLVRIKYNLYKSGIRYEFLLDTIAETGSEDETVKLLENMPIDDVQRTFNSAYLSKRNTRLGILRTCDWTVVVFVLGIYYVSLLTAFENMLSSANSK